MTTSVILEFGLLGVVLTAVLTVAVIGIFISAFVFTNKEGGS